MKNPEEILKLFHQRCPGVNKKIQEYVNKPQYIVPKYCFLTGLEWAMILLDFISKEDVHSYLLYKTLFTWQYSKTIYRFNETIYNSVIKTKLKNDLPVEVLYRIPYHCIYIELPPKSLSIGDRFISGLFIHINKTPDYNEFINFLLNADTDDDIPVMANYPLYLIKKPLGQLIIETTNKTGGFTNREDFPADYLIEVYNKLLSLALYVFSNDADIVCHEKQQKEHQYSVKTRHGQKLFPAPKVKIFNVGDQIAKKIQEVNDYESGDKSVRAHIRQAHWHGYWTGKGRTEFKYNWLHPMLVNIEK